MSKSRWGSLTYHYGLLQPWLFLLHLNPVGTREERNTLPSALGSPCWISSRAFFLVCKRKTRVINHLTVINPKTNTKATAICYEPDVSEVWLLKLSTIYKFQFFRNQKPSFYFTLSFLFLLIFSAFHHSKGTERRQRN